MKKGYFFIIDAFIAMSIILLSLILIFSFHSSKPYQMQGIFLAEDVMDMLSQTSVEEMDNAFVYSLYVNGTNITHPSNTLIEQVAEFYVTNRSALAEQFVQAVIKNMVPQKYGFELLLYNSTNTFDLTINQGMNQQNSSEILVNSKRVVFGMVNESVAWGPMTAEVRIWK